MPRKYTLRRITPAELLYLRNRVYHLARIGADAAELADAATEFFFYDRLMRTNHPAIQTDQDMRMHRGLHVLSPVEANYAFHSLATHFRGNGVKDHALHSPRSEPMNIGSSLSFGYTYSHH